MKGRPKKDDSYTVPLKAPENGHKGVTWGQIVEIKATEIPHRRVPEGTYQTLYEGLLLRLEQTDARHGLAVAFTEYKALKNAVGALRKLFLRHGKGFVILSVRKNPPVLYVMRGKNWHP